MKAGFASIDITPPIGVELCGYGYFLGRRAELVMDPLYVRAVSIQQGEKAILLINCDLIGLTQEFTDGIKEQLSSRLGLEKKSIMIACTHTHTGPATGDLIGCGEMDDSYMASLPDLLILAGVKAYGCMKKIKELKYLNKLPIDPIGFNRVRKDGPIDNCISGLAFRFHEGNPLAIVHYACHPVTLGPAKEISADYPGRVVSALSENGYDGLFLNGFCGDIDPVSNLEGWGSGTTQTIDEYGQRITNAFLQNIENGISLFSDDLDVHETTLDAYETELDVHETTFDAHETAHDAYETTFDAHEITQDAYESTLDAYEISIDLKLQSYDEAKIDEEYSFYKDQRNGQVVGIWADKMKEHLKTSENPYIESVTVQILKISNILIVGFPGEAFTELANIASQSLPGYQLIALGNCNSTMRYIPTEDDITSRGYAGHSSCFIYGRLPLIPGEGERLARSLSNILAE